MEESVSAALERRKKGRPKVRKEITGFSRKQGAGKRGTRSGIGRRCSARNCSATMTAASLLINAARFLAEKRHVIHIATDLSADFLKKGEWREERRIRQASPECIPA